MVREGYRDGLALATSADDEIHGLKTSGKKKNKAEEKRRKSISAIQASIHEKTAIKPATAYNVSHTE